MKDNGVSEKSIAEKYPYYFKLEVGDLQWYESFSFEMLLSMFTTEIENAAKKYGMNSIAKPEDHSESVDNCTENFCNGACWYMSNHDKLIIQVSQVPNLPVLTDKVQRND